MWSCCKLMGGHGQRLEVGFQQEGHIKFFHKDTYRKDSVPSPPRPPPPLFNQSLPCCPPSPLPSPVHVPLRPVDCAAIEELRPIESNSVSWPPCRRAAFDTLPGFVAETLGTKTSAQVRSHAQKHFNKLEKARNQNDGEPPRHSPTCVTSPADKLWLSCRALCLTCLLCSAHGPACHILHLSHWLAPLAG